MFQVGAANLRDVSKGEICMICLNCIFLPGRICVICTCFAGWDLYDLDLEHNFYVSVKKDLDDLDRDLS